MRYFFLIIILALISVVFYEPHREAYVEYAFFPCSEFVDSVDDNNIVYNNVIYGRGVVHGIYLDANTDDTTMVVYNNIFYDMGGQ